MAIVKTKKAAKTAAPKTEAAKVTAPKKTKTTKTTAVKTAVSKTTAPKTKKVVCIDYPSTDETVYCGHYCFRLGTPHNAEWMKVSVNGGPWQDCRPSNGYWWFDWWNFETGAFFAEALALIDGQEVKTAKRKFKVKL